jgi:hypothetical protein
VFHDIENSNKKFYFAFFAFLAFLVYSDFFGFFETFLPFIYVLIEIENIL